jgi:hypothetical protein
MPSEMSDKIVIFKLQIAIKEFGLKLQHAKEWAAKFQQQEKELKQQFGDNPNQFQCRQIHKLKQYRKQKQSDIEYFQQELDKAQAKLSVYQLLA